MDKKKVSVVMPVYNHEKYIKKAIQSVLSQKVNFDYELIIGDDCSTDESLKIINEFSGNEHVKIISREHNISNAKIMNSLDLILKAKGEYVIILEGDDYWTDRGKLQKQVDFLDNHPSYIACAHRFDIVNEQGEKYYDEDCLCQFWQKNPYGKKDFEKGYMISHLNTILFRNSNKDMFLKDLFINIRVLVWDYLLNGYLILNGKIHCIDKTMSVYRKVIDIKSSSYSSHMERINNRDVLFKEVILAEKMFNKKFSVDFTSRKKSAFASAVFKWYRDKNKMNFSVVLNDIRYSKQCIKYILYFVYLITSRCLLDLCGKKNVRVKF